MEHSIKIMYRHESGELEETGKFVFPSLDKAQNCYNEMRDASQIKCDASYIATLIEDKNGAELATKPISRWEAAQFDALK